MRAHRALAATLLVAAWTPVLAAEGPARLTHARLEVRSAAGGLAAALSKPPASPSWFGYAVPAHSEHRGDWSSNDVGDWAGRCSLEGDDPSVVNIDDRREGRAGSDRLLVFLRAENGRFRRLRVFSADCTVDAGGMPVVWLEDVRPSESVAWLERFDGDDGAGTDAAARDGRDPETVPRDRAVMAIALHADPSADAALDRFASPKFPNEARKRAIFWLGNARGRRGWESLARLAKDDPSDDIRHSVTFALSQNTTPEAFSTLIAMARRDASPHVRSQALFWLAHKAGDRAAAAIEDAIRDDPETEVKKKAVFALTQLPSDQSVTELIRVARTNRNAEVRKQAFFWLGQSKDPRAMACIEEVLTR